MVSEENLRRAFDGVKKDILEIKDQLLHIAESQEKLESAMTDRESVVQIRESPKMPVNNKPAKKTAKKTAKKKKK